MLRVERGREEEFEALRGWLVASAALDRIVEATEILAPDQAGLGCTRRHGACRRQAGTPSALTPLSARRSSRPPTAEVTAGVGERKR